MCNDDRAVHCTEQRREIGKKGEGMSWELGDCKKELSVVGKIKEKIKK